MLATYTHGTAPHINTFELGQHGRSRTDVWDYAGVNTFKAGRLAELSAHPTVKPVVLVAAAIRDCSRHTRSATADLRLHRFKKGRSGNPKGRPKARIDLGALIAERLVSVRRQVRRLRKNDPEGTGCPGYLANRAIQGTQRLFVCSQTCP